MKILYSKFLALVDHGLEVKLESIDNFTSASCFYAPRLS